MMETVLDILLKWAIPFVCTAIASASIAYVKGVREKSKKQEEEEQNEAKAIKDGLQCLLRAELIRGRDKYVQKGYCPVYARESLDKAYDAYLALNGKNVVTGIYEEIKKLPTVDHPFDNDHTEG